MTKVGRNAPCPCGSGAKYKKCCGDPLRSPRSAPTRERLPSGLASALRRRESDEAVRKAQQGLGRPILSARVGDHTVVATGNTIYWSKEWVTFADFLSCYIKKTLGGSWGNDELAKGSKERHPILEWYQELCLFQSSNQVNKDRVYSAAMTGAVYCYLGLAYSLFLLKHNAELQSRLVARLKDIKQFQGAYYEIMIANCLIRAGFALELEDESDQEKKHCEFAARSPLTGKRYWIEAKMRSVSGVLGKTDVDGSTSKDPTSRLTTHLSEALRKPAPDERFVFLDLNAEPSAESKSTPGWFEMAVRRLVARERDLEPGQAAYVFVTNMGFHRGLRCPNPERQLFAFGLGIPDFGKPGEFRLPELHKQKQKHIDAHKVMESFATYPQIPDTFDGRPASEAFHKSQRLRVGEKYYFANESDGGVVGTVKSVAVAESEKRAYVAITPEAGGEDLVLSSDMSDAELADYRRYGSAYFGETEVRHQSSKDIFELYEWLIKCHKDTPRERLLQMAEMHTDIERLKKLSRDDLVLELCEAWASSFK